MTNNNILTNQEDLAAKAAPPYVRIWMRVRVWMRSACLHALRKVCGNKLVLCVQMLY